MGSFQIVYDDFSGGQYMGPKSTNQPKNTWDGQDVITTPSGELIPVGTILCARNNGNFGDQVIDHWLVGTAGYVFTKNFFGGASRMLTYSSNFANPTVVQSTTNYTLPQRPVGDVAFSSITSRFYWAYWSGSTTRFYLTTGTGTSGLMSGTLSQNTKSVVLYKLRLLSWGLSRLFYTADWTGTDFGAWSDTRYYEFDSEILAVYPRTDDILVVCSGGVYSLTGVLGASVTIQLLIPGVGVADGMGSGDVVGRSLYYLDLAGVTSSLDGRLYKMSGASSNPVGTFKHSDYLFDISGGVRAYPGFVRALTNNRIATQFRTGWTYSETVPGVFCRNKIFDKTFDTAEEPPPSVIAKSGPKAPNDYICTATSTENNTTSRIEIRRTLINVPAPTYVDAAFITPSQFVNYTPSIKPVGTVQLPEYWHNKPFTVKEMFIEYAVSSGGTISASVTPTGVTDVGPGNLSSSGSSTVSDTTQSSGGFRMYRYWPNDSSKGFGMKPNLTLTNCTVKRVIVNCED